MVPRKKPSILNLQGINFNEREVSYEIWVIEISAGIILLKEHGFFGIHHLTRESNEILKYRDVASDNREK